MKAIPVLFAGFCFALVVLPILGEAGHLAFGDAAEGCVMVASVLWALAMLGLLFVSAEAVARHPRLACAGMIVSGLAVFFFLVALASPRVG